MKVGIITCAYEVPRIQSLLQYLAGHAEVRMYVEEDVLVNLHATTFDEDVLFTKGKGYALLTLARIAEAAGIPVVNSARATWTATHRLMASIACAGAGVLVPDDALGQSPPERFERYVVKNVIDQHHLRFLDLLPIVGNRGTPNVRIATAEEAGTSHLVAWHHYYQRYVDSAFEYKVYGFGETLLYYRQRPVLANRDKMSTRVPIEPIGELEDATRRAMGATGLAIASLDFLEEDGRFYLTDINPIPNFNYVPEGARIVGDYILATARCRARSRVCASPAGERRP